MTTLVLPGDALPVSTSAPSTELHLHLGPGTAQSAPRTHDDGADEDDGSRMLYVARKMGALQKSNKRRKVREGGSEVQTRVWVNVEAKRVSFRLPFALQVADSGILKYVPAVGENVVGIVTGRQGEAFKVDIGTAQVAQLSQYAFEGATKQMKPRLEVSFACPRSNFG